jgi:hypothetical protein
MECEHYNISGDHSFLLGAHPVKRVSEIGRHIDFRWGAHVWARAAGVNLGSPCRHFYSVGGLCVYWASSDEEAGRLRINTVLIETGMQNGRTCRVKVSMNYNNDCILNNLNDSFFLIGLYSNT